MRCRVPECRRCRFEDRPLCRYHWWELPGRLRTQLFVSCVIRRGKRSNHAEETMARAIDLLQQVDLGELDALMESA